MKYLSTVLVGLLTLFSFAQNEVDFHISGNIFNSSSSEIKVSRSTGKGFEDLVTSKMAKDGSFDIKGKVPAEDYYVLRLDNTYINVIIRKGSDFKVYGDGKNLSSFSNIVGSDESASLNSFANKLEKWSKLKDSALAIINVDRSQTEKLNSEIQPHFVAFQNDFQAFVNENQGSAALIVALGAIDPENDFTSYESIVKQIATAFPQSPTVQTVIQNYTNLKAQKEAQDIFASGKPAPDFEELMLDRKTTMKLSDLRGKVVLLDFWASWCGPCRKENPNVVSLYNQYKDKGFTVMSVSLDGDYDKWKQAIEADNLSWPNHVSDLKKWSSAAAQIYQVRGIPFTVLIDQEGNIIQTNLRGPALGQALSQLLDK